MQLMLLSAAQGLRYSPSFAPLLLFFSRMHISEASTVVMSMISQASSFSPALSFSLSKCERLLPREIGLLPSAEALSTPLEQTSVASRCSCSYHAKELCSAASLRVTTGVFGSENSATGKNERIGHTIASSFWVRANYRTVLSLKSVNNRGATRVNNVLGHSFVFHLFRLGLGLGLQGSPVHQVRNFLQGKASEEESAGLSAGLPIISDAPQGVDKAPREGLRDRPLRLFSGAYSLPHPDKEAKGGEDAYFVSPKEQALGVADGVGGWASHGVDAGLYARELMMHSMDAICQEPEKCIDPVRVLMKAHARTRSRGSSTACILTLSDYGLQAANLGDSGFLVLRNEHVVFKSPPQQHDFNFPYQLGSESSDPPSSAAVFSFKVEAGDTIILGTDGLFDNVFDNELTKIVLKATQAGLGPDAVAEKLANFARTQAQNPYCHTPFSTAAQSLGVPFYGGKLDDITVIVSFVIVEPDSSPEKFETSS